MRLERNRINFILSHLVLLLLLIVICHIPRLYPVIGERFLPPMNRLLRFYMIAVFSVAFLAYYLCVDIYRKSDFSIFKPSGTTVYFWTATAVVFLILCGSSALLSHDLFEYSIRGRMLSIYRLNPYLHTPLDIKSDMFFPLIFWKRAPECYGPLWVFIGAIHTLFFKTSVMLTSFMHKSVLLVFLSLSSAVFYRLSKDADSKHREITTLAFVLNPMIILMTLVDGHNEIAMTFFILCAFYLLVRSKYAASFIFLALAIAVKFVYVLLAPLFVLHILLDKGVKSVKEKIYGIVAGAASFVFITAVAWFPFGMKSVRAIFNYYAELGRNFWFDSIPYAVYFILGKTGMPVPKDMISGIFLCMFIAAYLSVLVYYLKKGGADKQALFTSSALILLTLLFTNSTPFQAWYLVWVIPLILLSDIKLKFQLVFLLSYFLIMTFWKRMCVLAVPMIIAYSLALLFYKDNPFKGRIKKCVKMY